MTTAATTSTSGIDAKEAVEQMIDNAPIAQPTPQARKLKPEIKALWLKALRSGEYAQTTGALEKFASEDQAGGFCCLGVLCKALANEGHVERVAYEENDRAMYRLRDSLATVGLGDVGSSGMPTAPIERFVMENPRARYEEDGFLTEWFVPTPQDVLDRVGDYRQDYIGLAELNDEFGYTFEKLADLIETHL